MNRAFTLIELLVVITIIVVLLAMLMPAMDKAIYEAEMAADQAQMRGIATGITVYASEYKRHYPDRPEFHDGRSAMPNWLAMPGTNVGRRGGGYDLRPKLRPYMGIKSLIDPFCPKVDINGSEPNVMYWSNYTLWCDWKFLGYRQLARLGDDFTWSADTTAVTPEYRFQVLVADEDLVNLGGPGMEASHPDSEGRLSAFAHENARDVVTGAIFGLPSFNITRSGWHFVGGYERGPSDYSFALTDNSVRRFDRVLVRDEPRMVTVPVESAASNEEVVWRILPAQSQ